MPIAGDANATVIFACSLHAPFCTGRSVRWNAEHAEKVLEQHAPEMGEEISGLVNDYVKARYTENDSSENQPKDHLATLKSLAQVGAEGRSKNQKSNKNRLLVAPSEG